MTRHAAAGGMAHARGGPQPVPRRPGLEHELSVRVLDTLLRENYADLRQHIRGAAGGQYLVLGRGPGLRVPLEPGGFLADLQVGRDASPLSLDDVLAALCDPRDRDGAAAFTRECHEALAAMRLARQHRPRVLRHLAALRRDGGAAARGPRGLVWYDALAAGTGHPVYPAAQCRLGFSADDYLRYAPEYYPRFELAWVALPAGAVRRAGRTATAWWPAPEQVGLPARLAGTHELLPVHPVTARGALRAALTERGLAAEARIAPSSYLRVIPTLSTRTVSVCADPAHHLKLPLPTSTLGLRNRRVITPASLADGQLMQAVLAAAARTDPLLEGLLVTDEGTYGHASHESLGYLLRRYPPGLQGSDIVTVGALLAPAPGGSGPGGPGPAGTGAAGAGAAPTGPRPCPVRAVRKHAAPLVIEDLASRWFGGDLRSMLDTYFRALFDTHVRLFVRYGIALEAHQQNTALVVDGSGIRLLVKDFDGALIKLPRLTAALRAGGQVGAPVPAAFADQRMLTGSDHALADVFITIVVHLCAGAIAFGLAEHGAAPLADLLGLIRQRLESALDGHPGADPAALLRARLFDAQRLPGKSMVIAGTLADKARLGVGDVNKFYGTSGPNYLRSSR